MTMPQAVVFCAAEGAMRADEKAVRQETDIWRDPVPALMKASCMPSALPPPARSYPDMT